VRVGKIISRVASEVDDTLNNALVAEWIDSAQLEIAKHYGRVVRLPMRNLSPEVEYELPADHLRMTKVLDSRNHEYLDFIVTGEGRFSVEQGGDYIILYHRVPDLLPPPSDPWFQDYETEVHEIFNLAIIAFCKAEYWDLESDSDREESSFADKYRQRFYNLLMDGVGVLRGRVSERGTKMQPGYW